MAPVKDTAESLVNNVFATAAQRLFILFGVPICLGVGGYMINAVTTQAAVQALLVQRFEQSHERILKLEREDDARRNQIAATQILQATMQARLEATASLQSAISELRGEIRDLRLQVGQLATSRQQQ